LQGLGLQVGDQIVALNGQAITSPMQFLNQLVSAAQGPGTAADASLSIMRGGNPLTLPVPQATLQAIAQARAQIGTGRGQLTNQNAMQQSQLLQNGQTSLQTTDTTGTTGVAN